MIQALRAFFGSARMPPGILYLLGGFTTNRFAWSTMVAWLHQSYTCDSASAWVNHVSFSSGGFSASHERRITRG